MDAALRISRKAAAERATDALIRGDQDRYLDDYTRFYNQEESREMRFGMPAFHFADPAVGVLLVHGYLASPEQMRPLLEHLSRQGITVYNVRISGHGTSVLDLASRTWRDWYYSVRYGYTILSRMVDEVFVCGFGMGGLLGWLLSAANPPGLSGIVSISAAMRPKGRYAAAVPIVDAADHLLRKMRLKERPIEFVEQGIGKSPLHLPEKPGARDVPNPRTGSGGYTSTAGRYRPRAHHPGRR